MYDMLIKEDELVDWVSENPQVIPALLEGYQAAISDMGSNLLTDIRVLKNVHVINDDFLTIPKYFMGFHTIPKSPRFILSCLYVFPEFRGQGLAKRLLNSAKTMVNNKGFIQAAVEEIKINNLDAFYKENGFISTNDIISNSAGMAYRDYFWSLNGIVLSRQGNLIMVQPVNNSVSGV
jgi:GNAT superfamily N-acetyltransferase